jgi:hypothetical protein
MNDVWKKISRLFGKSERRKVYEQLQWQRFLLQTGVAASAQVLDLVEEHHPLTGYVQIRAWVMIRVRGTITYRHIQTLVSYSRLPEVGSTVHIRYCPKDLSRVLII